MGEGLKRAFAAAKATRDDRVCDLGDNCMCDAKKHEGETCPHFHLPNPHVISAYSTHRKSDK